MTTTEAALNNLILEQGWAEGAVSPERTSSFLNRRMAALAIADAETEDFSDEELELFAA